MGKLLGELGIHGVKFTATAGTLATFLMALLDAVQKLCVPAAAPWHVGYPDSTTLHRSYSMGLASAPAPLASGGPSILIFLPHCRLARHGHLFLHITRAR